MLLEMITEYDKRQVRKMSEQLNAYHEGVLSLHSLMGDLNFLLNAIESIELSWKTRVLQELGELEEVYAVALYEGREELDEFSKSLVLDSLSKISKCIEEIPPEDATKIE